MLISMLECLLKEYSQKQSYPQKPFSLIVIQPRVVIRAYHSQQHVFQ